MSPTRARKSGPEASPPPDAQWRNRIVSAGEADPNELLANPANWRLHPKAQQRALAGALDRVGWVQQVLVNVQTGHVVDGHARLELAIARGEATVPVLYVSLEPQEEMLVLATLDPLSAMAVPDKDKLKDLLAGLTIDQTKLVMFVSGLGGGRGRTGADELPDLSGGDRVTPGDLWELGEHRLLCGDATDAATVGRVLAGETPALLVTDPPYGVKLDGSWRDETYNKLGPAEPGYMRLEGHQTTTLSGDTRVDWSEAFELVPSLHVGYVWHAGVHAAQVAAGLERIGFEIASQVVWDKGLFAMSRGWYHWAHEPCWVVRKPGVPNLFHGKRDQATVWHQAAANAGELAHPGVCCIHQGTVWRVPSPKMIMGGSKEEKFDHPAQKPVALSQIPIANHTDPGDPVYDPFLGSGTTLIAAETLGRRCYGLEIDPRFAQLIIERWEAFTGHEAVRA